MFNNSIPRSEQRRIPLRTAAALIQADVPLPIIDNLCMWSRRGWPDPARAYELASDLAKAVINGHLGHDAITELLQGWLLMKGIPIDTAELRRIVSEAGEPDLPRRVVLPLELQIRAEGDTWGAVLLRGTNDPAVVFDVIRRLSAYLFGLGCDGRIVALYCILWGHAAVDTPADPRNVLDAVLDVAAALQGVA